MGSVEQFAPVKIQKFHTKQITIKHLPAQCSQEQLNSLVAKYGTIEKVDLVSSESNCLANVTYESADNAKQAYETLNGHEYEGTVLKVDYVMDKPRGRSKSDSRLGSKQRTFNPNSVPLRILVPSQYIGAIIGKKGESIKAITTKCKARVDVHGKDNNGLVEKMISIYGQPENCSNACKEILLVINNEAKAETRKDVALKMLTSDLYCGRIIGKEGRVIKKIREDTSTRINVNSVNEMAMFPDRVISIRGSIENMVQAELAITSKLAQCMEHDLKRNQSFMPAMYMSGYQYGGGYPLPTPGATDQKYYTAQNGAAHPTRSCPASVGGPTTAAVAAGSAAAAAGLYPGQQQQPLLETSHIQVPNSAVGALIGAAGAHIKQMMRVSGAFILVENKKDAELTAATERIVTIRGTPEAIWKANYYVFETMRMEGYSGNDEVRLMTMLNIPRSAVGRVIGKSGRNVRDIQRLTGSIIKLPLDSSKNAAAAAAAEGVASSSSSEQQLSEEVLVEVHGTFLATQNAQRRIRALVELAVDGVSSKYGAYAPRYPRTTRSVTRLSTAA